MCGFINSYGPKVEKGAREKIFLIQVLKLLLMAIDLGNNGL